MDESCKTCELCASAGGELVWRSALCRVVLIDDTDYPGFCRVILNRHEPEMTDLAVNERQAMMRVVFAVESALRHLINPDKINLASLGNVTPHLHDLGPGAKNRCRPARQDRSLNTKKITGRATRGADSIA